MLGLFVLVDGKVVAVIHDFLLGNKEALLGSLATFYSTEGSSQCIRAMLYLALLAARRDGREPLILAARNVHKTFVTAVGLLDIEVEWIRSSPE